MRVCYYQRSNNQEWLCLPSIPRSLWERTKAPRLGENGTVDGWEKPGKVEFSTFKGSKEIRNAFKRSDKAASKNHLNEADKEWQTGWDLWVEAVKNNTAGLQGSTATSQQVLAGPFNSAATARTTSHPHFQGYPSNPGTGSSGGSLYAQGYYAPAQKTSSSYAQASYGGAATGSAPSTTLQGYYDAAGTGTVVRSPVQGNNSINSAYTSSAPQQYHSPATPASGRSSYTLGHSSALQSYYTASTGGSHVRQSMQMPSRPGAVPYQGTRVLVSQGQYGTKYSTPSVASYTQTAVPFEYADEDEDEDEDE